MLFRRFQFGVRALLLAVVVVAVAIHWFMLPTVRTHRFRHLIRRGDVAAASSMAGPRNSLGGLSREQIDGLTVQIHPLKAGDLWNGYRHITVDVPHGPGPYDLDVVMIVRVARFRIDLVGWLS
jgi:hypothetical protein